jgi:hypothetical protein
MISHLRPPMLLPKPRRHRMLVQRHRRGHSNWRANVRGLHGLVLSSLNRPDRLQASGYDGGRGRTSPRRRRSRRWTCSTTSGSSATPWAAGTTAREEHGGRRCCPTAQVALHVVVRAGVLDGWTWPPTGSHVPPAGHSKNNVRNLLNSAPVTCQIQCHPSSRCRSQSGAPCSYLTGQLGPGDDRGGRLGIFSFLQTS